MNQVTVVGLGRMGRAMTRAFVHAQREVTVWNRTPARAQSLVSQGANVAPSLADAVAASEAVVVCLSDYSVWNALLEDPAIASRLSGRTLIQMSSGTPEQARETASRTKQQQATYLDAAILGAPEQIGTDVARILVSGSPTAFKAQRELLALLGKVQFVGDNPGAAAALDCAALTQSMMAIVALIHGIAVCEAEGVEPVQLVDMLAARDSARLGYLQAIAGAAGKRQYCDTQASLATWAAVAHHLKDISTHRGIAADVPDFLCRLFERATTRGLGDKDIAALMEEIRPPDAP